MCSSIRPLCAFVPIARVAHLDWRTLVLSNLFSRLFAGKASPSQAHTRRMHFWSIVTIFIGLGFYVGIWTVLVADLTNALKLTPALLGIALSCFSCAGIVLLLFGNTLADR